MSKMELHFISTDKLVPYINNPRINDDAVPVVASSIKEFGFNVPLVLDKDNVIIAGHTRYKAAKMLGLNEVPCIYASDLSPAQIKAYRIADNKTAEYAKWNDETLAIELESLQELNFNLDLTALDEFEQERLLNPITDTDIDSFFEATEFEANMQENDSASDTSAREIRKVQCPHCKEWFDTV